MKKEQDAHKRNRFMEVTAIRIFRDLFRQSFIPDQFNGKIRINDVME